MMATANSDESGKQSFDDVEKPGKSAPSPTSRPVIINHGPMMKDPMVSKIEPDDPKTEEKRPVPAPSQKVVEPLNKTVESDTKPEPPVAEEAKKDPAKSENDAAVVEAVAGQAIKNKNAKPSPEETAKIAEVESLIEEKKYFLSIAQVKRRRNKRWLLGVIVVGVVLAGLYLAIYAGLLDIGVKLPYS